VAALLVVVGLTGCADRTESVRAPVGDPHARSVVRTFRFDPPWRTECADTSCMSWHGGPDAAVRVRTPKGASRVRLTVTSSFDYELSAGDSARVQMIGAPLIAPAPQIWLPPGDYPLILADPAGAGTFAWSQGNLRAEGREYSLQMHVKLQDGDGDGQATISGTKWVVIVAVTWN